MNEDAVEKSKRIKTPMMMVLMTMARSHYRLVKSYRQGIKRHQYAGTCRQEHQVCTEFFDGLEASATDYVDRPKWDRTFSAFSRPGGTPNRELTVVCLQVHCLIRF